jgi:hypothetical protein
MAATRDPELTVADAGGPVKDGPIDIIMLTHNRLEHLVATVDALEERTPEPYRLTIVDNASGPAVRNWLADNRHRFERLILRPANEHVPAFTHGIEATLSDPFVVTDPDVVVPELEPSWLARMLELMERHPDFGLIGIGLDDVNRPEVIGPEVIDPATVVDGEIVETGVGTVFQFIRRDALVTGYRSDGQACTNVRRAGYRVGWVPGVRGLHLGWDDFKLYPGHLLSKRGIEGIYPESYGEVDLIQRPPTIHELAMAAPAVAALRRLGIPDAAVLELAWEGPAAAPCVPGVVCLDAHVADALPLEDGSAGAVLLTRPPAERADALVREARRVAARAVVAIAPLSTFDGRTAAELAPEGWSGREAPAIGDLPLALAQAGAADPALSGRLESSTLDDRERWLELFGTGTFGAGELRLWIWERRGPGSCPGRVAYDPARVTPWRPESMSAPGVKRRGVVERAWRRLDLRDRADVWRGRLRRR